MNVRYTELLTSSDGSASVTFFEEEDNQIVYQKTQRYSTLAEAENARLNFIDDYDGFLPFEE